MPIPNTEVKSLSADGTAGFPGGRVGQCQELFLIIDFKSIVIYDYFMFLSSSVGRAHDC